MWVFTVPPNEPCFSILKNAAAHPPSVLLPCAKTACEVTEDEYNNKEEDDEEGEEAEEEVMYTRCPTLKSATPSKPAMCS